MKKDVFLDTNAEKELRILDERVQEEFEGYILHLSEEGRLAFPDAKKISTNLFEIRIRGENTYRGIYGYLHGNAIVMLHFFQKKSQRTPLRHIKVAQKRLKQYE